jgi:glutamate 5-kinase
MPNRFDATVPAEFHVPFSKIMSSSPNSEIAEVVRTASAVVVKVGTRVLTDSQGALDRNRIALLSAGLCQIADTGRQVVLVSSGAVAAGVAKLGLPCRPANLGQLQAVAAIGQANLIQTYETALAVRNRHAAQVLLTAQDLRRRSGYLNVRNALSRIHEYGAIAIINENDSVAVAELMTTFGDNDSLAAQVSGLLNEALLVILSDIDGLYTGRPELPGSQKIDVVKQVDDSVRALASDVTSSSSKGGMTSKLNAAATAATYGHPTIIAPGKDDQVLQKIMAGETIGTLFLAKPRSLRGRRRWIGSAARVEGGLRLDAGATKAVVEKGASLLAVGITDVEGTFSRGSVVRLIGHDGKEIGRGLSNYPSREVLLIKGLSTDQISEVLDYRPDESVVHRDNLALHSSI